MKAMSGSDIFEKMTNVNDRFIEEAAEMPNPEQAVVKTSRWERFSHFMNSGWGVAMICCLVAMSVLTGIIIVGRIDLTQPPASGEPFVSMGSHEHDTTPHKELKFSFHKEMYCFIDGSNALGDPIPAGVTLDIKASIINFDEAFTLPEGVVYRAEAKLVLRQEDPHAEPVAYHAVYPLTEEDNITEIPRNMRVTREGTITIPKDAPAGQYDLYLYFMDAYEVYEKAVTVYSVGTYHFGYSEGYVEPSTTALPGQSFAFMVSMSKTATPKEQMPAGVVPRVYLSHKDLHETFDGTVTVRTSQERDPWAIWQDGTIYEVSVTVPLDATEGIYHVCVAYGDETRTFYDALEVYDFSPSPDDKLQSFEINGKTLRLSYQKTYAALDDIVVDLYRGEDKNEYEFYVNTNVLKDFTNHAVPYPVPSDKEATMTEKEAKKIADELFDAYGPGVKANYEVEISEVNFNGGYSIYYEYELGGHKTDHRIHIRVNQYRQVVSFDAWRWHPAYEGITAMDINAAKRQFKNEYPDSDGYFSLEIRDGKLVIGREVIVYLDPEDEEYGSAGCGDHKHVFNYVEVKPAS